MSELNYDAKKVNKTIRRLIVLTVVALALHAGWAHWGYGAFKDASNFTDNAISRVDVSMN